MPDPTPPLHDDEKPDIHEVADYHYFPGWWEPGPGLSFYVNRDAWQKLPSSYREALTSAATEAGQIMQARYDALNPGALTRLRRQGVKLRRYSDDILKAAEYTATDVLEEQAAKDPRYRKVYEAWSRFREESFEWFGTAELAYAEFAFERQE